MAAAVELATGYVTLTVETSQVSKAIGKVFNAGESIAVSTGQRMSKALANSLNKVETSGLDKLQAEFEDAGAKAEQAAAKMQNSEARLAASIEQASRKRADARRQVEIAEQRLKELQDKGTASASQLMAAEDKVTRARQKYVDVSRSGITSVTAFQKEVASSKEAFAKAEAGVDEARAALKKFEADAKDAAAETEQTGNRFSRAFAGVKQKISASFNGAFDSAKAEAKDAGDAMEREFKDAGKKSGGGFKESFKGAFAGLAAYVGVQEVIGGFKNAIMGAGDLEQSVGAVDTVFKENAGTIHTWARDASTTLGLSVNSYNEFATLIGAQLKNAGTPMEELGGKTNNLIALGADLASMYGGTTAEAVEALSSALKGEMDPIEKYGISLNDAALTAKGLEMGIEKSNGAFTDQQKKLITQALLFQQSADAQGNFAREADTFQGKLQRASAQWENISAKIGELFLPALTGAMGFIGNFALPVIEEFVGGIRAFREAWIAADGDITSSGFAGTMESVAYQLRQGYDFMQKWYPVWAPFAAGVTAMTGAFVAYKIALQAVATAQGIMTAVTTAWQIATGVQTGMLWGLTAAQWAAIAPIAIAIGAIVALAVGLKMAYENVGWFRDAVDTAWAWIKQATENLVAWWIDVAWPAIGQALAAAGEWFTGLYENYVKPVFAWISETVGEFHTWWETIFVPAFALTIQRIGEWFTWLNDSIIQPVWKAILVTITFIGAILLTIFDGIVWLVRNTLGPIFVWLWESVIQPVFTWISDKVQGFADFWSGTVVPSINFSIDVLNQGWQRVSDTVSAVWGWISDKISSTWAWIRDTLLSPLAIFLDVVVGSAFRKMWETVSAVWGWISDKISTSWNWIKQNVLSPLAVFLDAVVGSAFRKMWETVSAVWGWISDKISTSWNWIKQNVLNPMGEFLENQVVGFFERTRDAIGRVWDGIKNLVREPVRFVIDTVINGGIIKNYNKLNDFWGGDDLNEMKFPAGFATGGYTGPGSKYQVAGVVHADEFVVQKSARRRFERENPGVLDHINRTGTLPGAASGGHTHGVGAHCAHCAASGAAVGHSTTASTSGAPPSGTGGIWGAFQQQIARAGRLFVPKMRFMGVDTENVARAWMGRSAVDIVAGDGSPSVSFAQGGAGTYGFNAGSQIWMQSIVPANLREAVLIHELGHALSLHHTMNRGSIMHPLQAGPTWPSSLDYGSLVRAWGKPGEGVKTYTGGDGGGFDLVGMIAEKLTSPVKKLFGAAREKFSGNGFTDIPIGIGEKMLDSIVDWARKTGGDGASMGIKPALYDKGGLIHRGVQIIDHQRSTPDYVLTERQWETMYQLAENQTTNSISNQPIQVIVPEREGISPDTFGARIAEGMAWELSRLEGV